ncbi:unnamed protein product [Triticum turgidum subsp. durum]|uniref:Uncharacterized protein n=1 Tax=Triticum turgidum subsp. durum TaxID=4567 RepID=A0A9R1R5U9_TRITD|nr:unnamed protein product [Triticum turgidum subsp. durum]
MSKKKAVTTMTLKDFHGGSIPSELPLPSAPGVSARPPDRPTAPPSASSTASARPRTPAASSAAAAAAAVPSFLTNPSRIGRHFDEDERTPFELAAPRRPAPSPPSFPSVPAVAPARSGPGNAWGAKREVAPAAPPVVPAASSGQIWSATRIAQASAVEKVISGRWHLSKPSSPPASVSAPVLETQVVPPEMERSGLVGTRGFDTAIERPSVMQVEVVHEARQNVMVAKTGVAGADAESRATVERPRLNLKPRSNGVGQSGESAAKERPSLFGGARPREQVLRDRGVDALASDLEITSPVGRSKNEFAKVEQKVEGMTINPSGEKAESFTVGHRGPRNADRKDYRRDTDRADAYRPTRRDESRKVARDVEKQPEQQRPEPETWRKPVEPPKPEVTAPRFGKAATALELAQAFSKSMSDTVPQSRLTSVPSPRVPPSPGARDQVGFSRLTNNGALHSGSSQRKINGY